MCKTSEARQTLNEARKVAEYARSQGASIQSANRRPSLHHVGAVFADSVLQAGVKYETVVKPRVEKIISEYPEALDLHGLQAVLAKTTAAEFLTWHHPVKVGRFERLVDFFSTRSLCSAQEIVVYLLDGKSRSQLLEIDGVGPKTFDYLCTRLGLDRIAVDRHVITFASEAGVVTNGYDHIQRVASYAADLLGVMRRDFDAWMWNHVSSRTTKSSQLLLDI